MDNLLIATDFSPNASHAARYGYHLAWQMQVNVCLCHAMTIPAEIPQAGFVNLPDSELDGILQDCKSALLQLAKELEHHAGATGFKPKIMQAISADSVTAVVQEQLTKHPAEMVIMGTHANSAVGTFLLGNHCQKMRDCLHQAILLVPPVAKILPVKRIAFASDFSDPVQDMESINALIEMAKKLDAKLILTHIYNDENHSPDFLQWTKHLLLELIERADYPKIDYMVVEDREVEHGLGVLISHEHINMLAMVHHEHSFLYELVNKSHSWEMADQICIPLMIFKSKAI